MNKKFKNIIIHLLGGYTEKEYNRIERKYQGLLDSKTTNKCISITNEYLYRQLRELDFFARKELYGKSTDIWATRMYNIIHNNFLRILVRYLHTSAPTIYKLDTTLDDNDQFLKIMQNEGFELNDDDMIFVLEND